MTPTCGKCAGVMENGFVLDTTYGGYVQEHWAGGNPEAKEWLGLPLGVKVESKNVLPVVTWRCTACGFLEAYASKK